MEFTAQLINEIYLELKRIKRPVVREEFSYIPSNEKIADRVRSILLSFTDVPAIKLVGPDKEITLPDALEHGLMDVSDLKTILYILKQIGRC